MNESWSTVPTFDALRDANLDQIYEQGKEEVLRNHAFRVLLACTNTIEKLERLAYAKERWVSEWSVFSSFAWSLATFVSSSLAFSDMIPVGNFFTRFYAESSLS